MNTLAAATSSDAGPAVGLAVIAVLSFIAYWVPWFIAWRRHVPNTGAVFVINLFAGWTLIGWVVALAMAVRTRPAAVPAAPTR